ncbi:MAG: heme-binding protein [Ectothiorhodospiraceae bacterium]|nr:heme-binding protein [Ectothiorhodospiraceae bacterium]
MKNVIISWVLIFTCGGAYAGQAETDKFYTFRTLSFEMASKVAHAALYGCREQGYSVAVAVVDRGGNLQVLLRDWLAGPHTPETARRKAWTANSFHQSTAELADFLQKGLIPSQVQHNPGALLTGGGVMIRSEGELLGAVGVAGAPPGQSERDSIDGACAQIGIDKIQEDLDFGG